MTQIIRARTVALWRASIRLLRTDKERVSSAERWIRALLLIVPYYAMALLLNIRAARWRPLTVDGISDDGIRLRCQLPEVLQMYVYLFGAWEPDLEAFMRRRLRPGTPSSTSAPISDISALWPANSWVRTGRRGN
ncbi:methyltransferase domain protein [Mycobacterium xenopi 4042]|uniref:Methyltransferase domain protein n=1 Tax=Mycobacterium xenopi 4042 TaxID=1299334 RepID=X8CN16_MYCXE|nr:methyltransferase domain protein [Mycobacterium xenopi 4042]